MTYTFEDFKREHSEEIVEKFKNAWGKDPDHYLSLDEYWRDDLCSFCAGSFLWNNTKDGSIFWGDVADGKHRKSVAAESPKVPAIENPLEKNMLKQKWQQLTMALGVWLIGGRETPRECSLKKDRDWWRSEAKASLEIISDEGARLFQAIRERDEARKSSDEHYHALKAVTAERDDLNESLGHVRKNYQILLKRHESLRTRYNTLRYHSIPHPFKFAKTSSKKPKAKRVKK